jgi:fumarate reductase subunit D
MKQKLIHFTSYLGLPVLFAGLSMTGIVYAQTSAPNPIVTTPGDLGKNLFCPIISWMFWILIAVAVIMVMWAAFIYLTAGDDTEKVHRATKTLTYAAIAVVVALLARGFPALVANIFSASGTSPFSTCVSITGS